MSEDENPKYKDGDIVWVKIGGCWWPGEVTENGPEDFTAKKPPLVIVKFFNESTYEFVKSYNNIYFYNCDRKNEFIKKGMDSFRGNNAHMEKFPGDVSLAELRTDGNPNILSEAIFAPQKKTNIIAEVFGNPSPKKTPKDTKGRTQKNSKKSASKLNITHRRFLGCDDYEAHIRVQFPGKDSEQISDGEEIEKLNAEPTRTINCSSCTFSTTRLEVMLFHVQCHIKGITSPVPVKKKKQSPKKKQKRSSTTVIKHITSEDDRANSTGYGETDSDDEMLALKPKRKKRPKTVKKIPEKKEEKEEQKEEATVAAPGEKIVTDIRQDLLAEWSDSEEDAIGPVPMETDEKVDKIVQLEEEKEIEKEIVKEVKEDERGKQTEKVDTISNKDCFDFDEDLEEEESNIVHTGLGRKIPRVIPPPPPVNEKRKSLDRDSIEASLPIAEDDENRMEIIKTNENTEVAKEEEVFKDLMDSTSVPELPELPIKPPTTLKPDKTEVATKLTNPKKRFVKSFEDFELLQNEQRKKEEEREEELRKNSLVETTEPFTEPSVEEKLDSKEECKVDDLVPPVEISKLKCKIMSKLSDEEPESHSKRSKGKAHRTPRSKILESYRNDRYNEQKEEQEKQVVKRGRIEEIEPQPEIVEPEVPSSPFKEEAPVSEPENSITPLELEMSPVPELASPVAELEPAVTELEPEVAELEPEVADLEPEVADLEPEVADLEPEVADLEHEVADLEPPVTELEPPMAELEHPMAELEPPVTELPSPGPELPSPVPELPSPVPEVHPAVSEVPATESEELVVDSEETSLVTEVSAPTLVEEEEVPPLSPNDDDELPPPSSPLTPPTPPSPPSLPRTESKDEVTLQPLSEIEMKDQTPVPPPSIKEKSHRIDEYFNDLLFSFDKKTESPSLPPVEEPKEVEMEDTNELHIKCDDSTDLSIKTNLTNFNKNDEEMSALSTLAMVSQLESIDKSPEEDMVLEEPPKIPYMDKPEPELVPIDGNLTVVSEKELADAQVEITAETSPPYKKPVTLTNFSMDFSECNSSSSEIEEPKSKSVEETVFPPSIPEPEEALDLEDHIPSQIVDKTKLIEEVPPTSKLLERLTTSEISKKGPTGTPQKTKFVIKSTSKGIKGSNVQNKPIILSEKIIKPQKATGVSVQKISAKRNLVQDADEIDAFIIQKGNKTNDEDEKEEVPEVPAKKAKTANTSTGRKRGKAKILQQTIITPAGEILQPTASKASSAPVATATTTPTDDNVFDINSMPIVLSDQILTPESIENMPIFLSDSVQGPPAKVPITKKAPPPPPQMRVINKNVSISGTERTNPKQIKPPKILGSVSSKLIKQNSFASGSSKHGKYVIVTSSSPASPATSKYTVGKRQTLIKRGAELMSPLTKLQNIAPEPSGNKIMVLTNQQGQQQRVLLTPAQQKMMGMPGTKVTKTLIKGQVIQKAKDGQLTSVPGSSGLLTKTFAPSSRFNTTQLISPLQNKTMRIEKSPPTRRLQMQPHKVQIKQQQPQQKTILIKNQHGQTVRKIQGTDDALLDQQVAQQIEAIKASGVLNQKQEILNFKSGKSFRKAYPKKLTPSKIPKMSEGSTIPPLAPISPKKTDLSSTDKEKPATDGKDRPLNQLVIQDALGNQTTITEGQILALPSETIDGQPQSYVLVTLDESGNLTPLNNEALLSLDPNLGLGGDLSNAELQIDQSALRDDNELVMKEVTPHLPQQVTEPEPEPIKEVEVEESVTESINQEPPTTPTGGGEPGQQLIVTGDPIAAQKFLESLTEGSTDLANILANAEGSSILIHADGQQILINTDSDNQMLLSVNTDNLNIAESSEGGGNPIFATQPPSKNQDILAAALADTDVFQQEQNGGQGKLQSQLSPSSSLYPINVGNVLETSLTLNSPIMTPLEVPSNNTKKISDETDILSQVPKNVDLPITITDPNISQTVAQQQLVNDLQNNLELTLPIPDSAITVTSTEMNSPSFVYSLPNLDGGVDINQKPFNSSMPLLTEEETIETSEKTKSVDEDDKNEPETPSAEGSFLDESEGLCTLGGEMCSSLSEPPPDMFDLSAVLSSHQMKSAKDVEEDLKIDEKMGGESASEESTNPTVDEDSCEIPVQPEIVTTFDDGDGEEGKIGELENGGVDV